MASLPHMRSLFSIVNLSSTKCTQTSITLRLTAGNGIRRLHTPPPHSTTLTHPTPTRHTDLILISKTQSAPKWNFSTSCRTQQGESGVKDSNTIKLEVPDYLTDGELHVFEKLIKELNPIKLEVKDVSGGCGSMYAIEVESAAFKGMTMVKQHRHVQEILAEEIKGWHGVQLKTKKPA